VRTPDENLMIACAVWKSSNGKSAGWLVFKIDSQGNPIWTTLLRQTNQQLRSAALSSDGQHLLLTGFRPVGKTSAYAISLDANGNLEWKLRFRIGSQAASGFAAAAATDGGFAVAGGLGSSGHGFLGKINAEGDLQSAVTADQSLDLLATSGSHYTLFGNDQNGTVLANIDSNFNIPGCDLFQPVKPLRLKFGRVKVSTPPIVSVVWSPVIASLDFRSKTVSKPDSKLCP